MPIRTVGLDFSDNAVHRLKLLPCLNVAKHAITRRFKIRSGLFAALATTLFAQTSSPTPATTDLCDLIQHLSAYAGKVVELRIQVLPGIEDSPTVLMTSDCSITGHLVGVVMRDTPSQSGDYKRLKKMIRHATASEATIIGLLERGPFPVGGTGIVLEARLVVYSVSKVVIVEAPRRHPA